MLTVAEPPEQIVVLPLTVSDAGVVPTVTTALPLMAAAQYPPATVDCTV
jgi:hypothetical protein